MTDNEKAVLLQVEAFLCDMTLITGCMTRSDGEAKSWDAILSELGAVSREAMELLKSVRLTAGTEPEKPCCEREI